MKEFFVSDCVQHENKIITSTFVVVSRQVKPKKSGEPYLALTLGDRSGHIEAKMWDNVEDAIDGCNQDDFIKAVPFPELHHPFVGLERLHAVVFLAVAIPNQHG